MGSITLEHVKKSFGASDIIPDASLEIADGSFVVFVGPSGCGKTTLLRLIAGLEHPSHGDILIGGQVVTRLPPRARQIAMVFQSYALYPHKTVFANIAFPLAAAGMPRDQRPEKVRWAAGRLGIDGLLDRRPRQLSGGERQRVALARALVREPQVFLLDEPLSNLDAKLRASARDELKEFQQRVGITTIYVTHDQVEAMGLGDRIAVLNEGKIQQIGTPDEIYHHPANTFVATFVGSPPMNLLTRDGKLLGFRPEQFLPASAVGERPGQVIFDFAVTRVENLGSDRYVYGHLPGVDPEAKVIAKLPSTATTPVYVGDRVPFAVSGGDLRYFDQQSGTLTAPGEATVKP